VGAEAGAEMKEILEIIFNGAVLAYF